MKSKNAYLLVVLAVIIVLISYSALTLNSLQPTQNGNSSDIVQKIEIIHFHPTHQCFSCITVGAYAEETVNTFFQNELSSGKLVFMHINIQLVNNSEIVEKYGVTGSSIWIGIYNSSGFYAEQNANVWYKIYNRTEFMDYFRGVIEDKLTGA